MHEMSLCQGVIDILEAAARTDQFTRVTAVTLEIGVLGHVEPDAMVFCFDAVSRGTIVEGARLVIERIAGAGWCLGCRRTVALTERFGGCPICGQHQVQIISGEELRVREMEVE